MQAMQDVQCSLRGNSTKIDCRQQQLRKPSC
jgi:hypothetical protein